MDVKVKRYCTECGKKYAAASGHVCEECWPEYKKVYPEWLEWLRVRGPGWE